MEKREPGCNEVVLRVLACGVCGSDIHMMEKSLQYAPLGHEISAQVVAVGNGVYRVKAGDTVIVEDVTLCGVCTDCKNGNTQWCKNAYNLNGQSGMGEYLIVRENSLVPYAGMDPSTASLTEPLAVALNTYLAAKIPLHGTLVVFGMGVLGLMCVRLAKYYGAHKVICVGSRKGSFRNAVREEAAYKLGADAVFYSDENVTNSVIEKLNGKKADGVIVTSPPNTVSGALQTAKYGANIVVIGLDLGGNAKVEIDIDQLIFNKHSLVPVFAEPAKMFPLSIELLKAGVIDAKILVTHTVGMSEVDQLKKILSQDTPIIKVVILND